jgi:hypothetical protein
MPKQLRRIPGRRIRWLPADSNAPYGAKLFKFPRSRRVAAEETDLWDSLLEQRSLAPDLPADLRRVGEVLGVAAGPAQLSELDGEEAVRTAFNQVVGVSTPNRPRRLRRPAMLSTLLSAKLALAAAAAAAAVGGTAAAAYTNSLPPSVQTLAHQTIGAPPPHSHTPPASVPVGPDPTGHAAYGLCTAYASTQNHGSASDQSIALHNLTVAAGGAGNVDKYCSSVSRPGSSTSHPSTPPASHPAGPPASPPSHPSGSSSNPPSLPSGSSSGQSGTESPIPGTVPAQGSAGAGHASSATNRP